MTYNEWRDELKNNLLCVTEVERRRVLDYYAEAYADRRDAGFTEREIIAEFGAPYDAAQKILYENAEDVQRDSNFGSSESSNRGARSGYSGQNSDPFSSNSGRGQDPFSQNGAGYGRHSTPDYDRSTPNGQSQYAPPPPPPPEKKKNFTWLIVILCICCAAPLFGILMGIIGATIGIIAAPFGILISGVATIGAGIGLMFTNAIGGAVTLGMGLMLFGAGLMLIPLASKLVKLIWWLVKKVFGWVKGLLSERRKTV